ncbi:MAG: hypothetical protein AAF939_02415 [Planctomycetota bacterium]
MDNGIAKYWPRIMAHRVAFADQIKRISDSLPGPNQKRLAAVLHFFESDRDVDEAYMQPDVISLCLPLCEQLKTQETELTDDQMTRIVRRGFFWLSREHGVAKRIFQVLIYPALVTVAVGCMVVLFSSFVAPQFATTYEEFGIQLPVITVVAFRIAKLVRTIWPIAMLVIGGLVVTIWILTASKSNSLSSFFEQRLIGKRYALADWAWHQALLLEAGLSFDDAIALAGKRTRIQQLSDRSRNWAKFENRSSTKRVYFSNRDFALLNHVMNINDDSKSRFLQTTAIHYWNRNRSVSEWWIHWLSLVMLVMVSGVVFMLILALFLPMLQLISGLTGF